MSARGGKKALHETMLAGVTDALTTVKVPLLMTDRSPDSKAKRATFDLYENGNRIEGTIRQVKDSDGSFAMEWLFASTGGPEIFSLRANAGFGDQYLVQAAQITLEVVQDTRCQTFIIIPPTLSGPVDSE